MTPVDLYRACQVSACRLETLQHYAGDEEERQRAFLAGEPLPPPGPGKRDDLELIAALMLARRVVQRVHVVGQPLSDYIRYELAAYADNAAAGEDIRIADRSAHRELGDLGEDFTIFDAGTSGASVILFRYDARGRLHGYRHATDQETVMRCSGQYSLALACSVLLHEFIASVG
jgi:hypothetical protein